MDGIHDLGGQQGHGPIATTTEDPAFPMEWEGRAYAMVQTVGDPGSTIDWFRHLVELLPPAAYLTEPYFQKWQYVQLIEMMQAGLLNMDEILSGTAHAPGTPAAPKSFDEVMAAIHRKGQSYEVPVQTAPKFAPGDRVVTQRHRHEGHTRLPLYARNQPGTVLAHHGAHLFPDTVSQGIETGEHLYTVAFAAQDLWGDTANPNDDVTLDLWESYLVSA